MLAYFTVKEPVFAKLKLLSKEEKVQECDARKDDRKLLPGPKKILTEVVRYLADNWLRYYKLPAFQTKKAAKIAA